MRLAKLSSQKNLKNSQQKYEQSQLSNNDWVTKGQTGGFVKRFSGTLSILSSNNSGSGHSSVAGVNNAARNSFGNGSCISSLASTNNSCPNKRRKSKTSKCFSSTVFRCCLPCRGGSGSAAPATSPPQTPVPSSNANKVDSTVKRKRSGKSSIELTTDGNESFIESVKKHSLADTIGTSATTPISLKNLINDEEEEDLIINQHISAADIAAATLASGILPRKAEPETLSDTSISPTTAVLQLAAGSASVSSLLSTTSLISSGTTTTTVAATQTVLATTTQSSPTSPPNISSTQQQQSSNAGTYNSNIQSQTTPTQATTTAAATTSSTSTPSRCCCPPPQTSPLPHIKEEEESEQLLQRQHSANQEEYETTTSTEPTISERHQQLQQQQQQQQSHFDQLSPYTTANPSGSSDSCTSLSVTAATTTTASSITGCTPPQEFTTSTPSPRIKHKFRKQHKSGWSRLIFAPNSSLATATATSCGAANSSETLASSSNNSSSAATVSAAILAAAQTRLASSSASALAQQTSTSSQLLPASKMQAEQGSIGDLQKYHSRYLKNRRHTLANVR